MTTTNNEVAARQSGAVQQYEEPQDEILRSDIIVPYLSVGQGLSEAVTERRVQLGDIYKSTQKDPIGNPEKPLDVVFLHYPTNQWRYEEKPKDKSKFEFRRLEPRNATNENQPWSFWADANGQEVPPGTVGATEWRRTKQLTVFALLPMDIAAAAEEIKKAEAGETPDPTKALTPVILSFRSMSFNSGREVCSFFTQCKSMKVPIWKYKIKIGCVLEKNDQGTFYIWKIDRTKPAAVAKEHLGQVEQWAQIVAQPNTLQAHDEGDVVEGTIVTDAVKREVC